MFLSIADSLLPFERCPARAYVKVPLPQPKSAHISGCVEFNSGNNNLASLISIK